MQNPSIAPTLGGKRPNFLANLLESLIDINFVKPAKINVNATDVISIIPNSFKVPSSLLKL